MKRMVQVIVCIIASLISSTGEGGGPLINSRVPDFTLQDQFGKTISRRQFEGRVLVLIASDKKGSEQNGPWKKALISRYRDSIALIGLADVRTVPFFMKGKIKADFKNEEGSVLMDWKAELFDALALRKNVSNIVVVDQSGYLKYTTSGEATEDGVKKLFGEIDRLK